MKKILCLLLIFTFVLPLAAFCEEGETVDKIKIFIASDSTAQTYRDRYAPQAGWGQMLNLFFDDGVEIENRAIAGRSLKSFFNDGRWTSILNDARTGDYVIIQFGQNDGAYNKPERYISHEDFAVMLADEYIKPAREKGINVVIATQTQGRWFDPATGRCYGEGDGVSYASLLRDAAKEYNLPLLEVLGRSREMVSDFGEEESKKLYLHAAAGEFESDYSGGVADNTHFRYFGAFKIAEIVADELSQIDELKAHHKDGFVQTVCSPESGVTFDARAYEYYDDLAFSAVVKSGSLKINGVGYVADTCDGQTFKTVIKADGGFVKVEFDGEVEAIEITPVRTFENINTASGEYVIPLSDGTYDFAFTKSDAQRANIRINGLIVGANVDMYGTVGVPVGTVYDYDGFEVSGGAARITLDGKTTALAKIAVSKTPSIFTRRTRIWVGGDSTVCNYYPIMPPMRESDIVAGTRQTGWAQLLYRFMPDDKYVVNLAASGDWARNWRDNTFPTIISQAHEGDIFLLQFGINDRNRDDKTKDTMYNAMKDMTVAAKEKGINVVLIKPQPSVGYSWGNAGDYEQPNGNNGGFFDVVWQVANDTDTPFYDLNKDVGLYFASVGRNYVSQNYHLWNYEKNEMADKLHISYDGAKLICSTAVAGLDLENGSFREIITVNDGVYLLRGDHDTLINTNKIEKTVTLVYASREDGNLISSEVRTVRLAPDRSLNVGTIEGLLVK